MSSGWILGFPWKAEAHAKSCPTPEPSFCSLSFPIWRGAASWPRVWYSLFPLMLPVFEGQSRCPQEEGWEGQGDGASWTQHLTRSRPGAYRDHVERGKEAF